MLLPSHAFTVSSATRDDMRQLAATHRAAERAYRAAMRDGWAVCRGTYDVAADPSSNPAGDVALRIINAKSALATASADALECASAQLRALRERVMEIVARDAHALIRGTNAPWRHVAKALGLEWAESSFRLCDGTFVSAEPRIVRGAMRSGTVALFYRFGPGDPRAPRREKLR